MSASSNPIASTIGRLCQCVVLAIGLAGPAVAESQDVQDEGVDRLQETRHDPVPPTGVPAHALPAPELLREGAFLSSVRGEMRRFGADRWAFIFNPGVDGETLPPMAMLPCMTLSAMEQIVASRDGSVSFMVSGQVFVYRGRNYLLPTMHTLATDRREDLEAPAYGEANGEAPLGPDQSPKKDPSVDDLILALEDATPRRGEAPARLDSPTPGLLREGTYLVMRRGRIVREGSEWRFLIDNDVDDPIGVDPPMTLMPCQTLAMIEQAAGQRREGLSFVLSGRVFVYNGRNYLLPAMFVADHRRDGDLSSAL
ncbi:MAG: hypothetical protein EA376_11000 [Phycisphaeraceae bacterium]|nr:MAG: hypothetical protein EA376_11000 [Phycisphaeraceae bacterium]